MLAFAVAFFLGSGVLLKLRRVSMGISRARKTDTDYSAGKEKMTARSSEEVRTITIRLQNYSLDIQKRDILLRKTAKLSILKSIDTEFRPGVLNVIMG